MEQWAKQEIDLSKEGRMSVESKQQPGPVSTQLGQLETANLNHRPSDF